MSEAGHGALAVTDQGWPEDSRRRTMQTMRANGWSLEGLGRVFHMTPIAAGYVVDRKGMCGVCEVPHVQCSRLDWRPIVGERP